MPLLGVSGGPIIGLCPWLDSLRCVMATDCGVGMRGRGVPYCSTLNGGVYRLPGAG